jgi:hypothetical protein
MLLSLHLHRPLHVVAVMLLLLLLLVVVVAAVDRPRETVCVFPHSIFVNTVPPMRRLSNEPAGASPYLPLLWVVQRQGRLPRPPFSSMVVVVVVVVGQEHGNRSNM